MGITIDLTGRRFLVVGASSGIGRATALALGRAGGRVAVVGRRAAQLDEVVATLDGGLALPADLRVDAECERAVVAATEAFGGLDAVLFPIGYSPLSLLTRTDAATWSDVFATNVTAPALVTAAAVTARGDEPGLFVYLSSNSVGNPVHGLGAYTASKAALEHTIRSWRREHPEHRFLRLSVGATMPTEIHREFGDDILGELLPKWASSGLVTADFMHVDDVGAAVAQSTALALMYGGIALDDVTLNPASAPLDPAALQELGAHAATGERPDGTTGQWSTG
ncbi:short-chain dehydrogenase [Frankia sp. CcI49]|uniref:SDR family oxidoreductase n=1 Tax=unclassified Frankia TaxID=2632575 RepID=UPI0006CA4CEE|nr:MULTISPECIES: SDR family oxidoreductase [unclassified Frankia]KPM54132.1 short-chain dehydrogenase [Frankia sp. R43]ONH61562.1 short-chain dehydrogenase [Frankia sp. CcI49]